MKSTWQYLEEDSQKYKQLCPSHSHQAVQWMTLTWKTKQTKDLAQKQKGDSHSFYRSWCMVQFVAEAGWADVGEQDCCLSWDLKISTLISLVWLDVVKESWYPGCFIPTPQFWKCWDYVLTSFPSEELKDPSSFWFHRRPVALVWLKAQWFRSSLGLPRRVCLSTSQACALKVPVWCSSCPSRCSLDQRCPVRR